MKTDKILRIILSILALHLLYSNSELLRLLVHSTNLKTQVFSLLFGLSYSLITVLIIAIYPRWYVFSVSATLDATAVFLKYYPFGNERLFFSLTAVYFALYTGYIVLISGVIARSERQKQTALSNNNGKLDIEALLQRRNTLLRSIPRIKDTYTKQLKQRELEEVERLLESLKK